MTLGSPLALWHLLSLDAPTVAALWTWFLARANGIRLPAVSVVAMAIAVWTLYAADRLLDARLLDAAPSGTRAPTQADLEARHLFHYRHRRRFFVAMVLAAILLASLLPSLDSAAIRLYLTEGALLFAWFLILHATDSAHRLPKELAVGLFFAAATFIPTVARRPELRVTLLPDAALFAALCSLNCLYIYRWEHSSARRREAHITTQFALRHLHTIASAIVFVGVALAVLDRTAPVLLSLACALAALALIALDRIHLRLHQTIVRAAADFALLTPIVLLPFLR